MTRKHILNFHAFTWFATVAMGWVLIVGGCSEVTEPGNGPTGSITLSLAFETDAQTTGGATMAPPVIDSVAVSVFRANGGPLEVRKGVAMNGLGTNTISVRCVAENNKTVSVDLFSGGVMWYHGANRKVNVPRNASTNVNVDTYAFVVTGMTISPSVVADGETFRMSWNQAPAATFYALQESNTPAFDTIVWAAVMPDTAATIVRGPGAHYFRVAPATQFTTGTFTPVALGYVLGGGQVTGITGFDVPEMIPGEAFSIYGENLDMPGSEVYLGSVPCEIVSASWSEIRARVPLQATTDYVFVYSPLDGGATYWGAPFQVQRIAYVSNTGAFFDHYKEYIETYPNLIEFSTVAYVPAADLDWRDMSVFDLIVIANDMGTSASNWGGGVPQRADAIAGSGTDVLAIGLGGAIYLVTGATPASGFPLSGELPEMLYIPDETQSIFSVPTKIALTAGNELLFSSQGPVSVIAFGILPAQKPLAMRLLAESDPNSSLWTMLDFATFFQAKPVHHFFWGLAVDPYALTVDGIECFSNVISELYSDTSPVLPATSGR